jgi:hypothetical protein
MTKIDLVVSQLAPEGWPPPELNSDGPVLNVNPFTHESVTVIGLEVPTSLLNV